MGLLTVERLGGIAGFGGPGARIRSRGQIEHSSLSDADQQAINTLFKARGGATRNAVRDGFVYRIVRTTAAGAETIEVAEDKVPAALAACVKDELV